jgi:hypothetical protein
MFGLFESNPLNQIEIGRAAILKFHNFSCAFPAYTISIEDLVKRFGGDIFLEGFGFAIVETDASDSQVRDAMLALANQGQGRIPASQTAFFQALSNRTSNLTAGDWVSLTPAIAADVGKEVIKGTAEVGSAILDVGKSLLTIGPILVVAAVLYIGFVKTKQIASS